MSTLILKTLDRFSQPDLNTLVGQWSPARQRNIVTVECKYHRDGKIYMLTRSKKLLILNDDEYFRAMEESKGTAYQAMVYEFDVKRPEYKIEEGSDAYKFFTKYPNAIIDGKGNGENPIVQITDESVVDNKNFNTMKLKLKVQNYINGLSLDELKDICYYFSEKPETTSEKLILQLVNEKNGILWKNDYTGGLIAAVVETVFIENKDLSKESLIKIACNKAINFNIIQRRGGEAGKPAAFYWGDKFIDATENGLYTYFRNEPRMFDSLKNEIARVTGETAVKDKDILPPKVATKPNRSEMWNELQLLESEGFANTEGMDYRKLTFTEIEKLLNEAKNKKVKAPVV